MYDAFGVSEADTNPQATPLKFVGSKGYLLDSDSNFELLGHRYYSTATGRFLSQDPIKDGDNWYCYVENNPLGRVDPSGETLAPNNYDGTSKGLLGEIEDFLENIADQAGENSNPMDHDPGTLPNGKPPSKNGMQKTPLIRPQRNKQQTPRRRARLKNYQT